MTASRASDFVIGGIASTPSGATFDPSTPSTTAGQSFSYDVTGLTAGTQYVFQVSGLTTDGSTALTPTATVDSPADCTSENNFPVGRWFWNYAVFQEKYTLFFFLRNVFFVSEPAAVTNLAVDSSGTSDSEIKITWTNPSAAPGELAVEFDSFTETLSTVTETEHIFKYSAANTPLTAGKSGKCKVVTKLTSGDCDGGTNSVEIDCKTTSGKT